MSGRGSIRTMYVRRCAMRKKLTRQGNSAALVIDRPILELLGMKPGSVVEVLTDGRSLLVRPVGEPSPERRRAFQEALEEANQVWGDMLRRLSRR